MAPPSTDAQLGFIVHEMRNQLNTAMLALTALKMGNTSVVGETGEVLERSLNGLLDLIGQLSPPDESEAV